MATALMMASSMTRSRRSLPLDVLVGAGRAVFIAFAVAGLVIESEVLKLSMANEKRKTVM
jgi:hypothetical protein